MNIFKISYKYFFCILWKKKSQKFYILTTCTFDKIELKYIHVGLYVVHVYMYEL